MVEINETMDRYREDLKRIGADILGAKKEYELQEKKSENEDSGEVIANLMLAYRHIEDASMRCGKVKQAMNGGVSSYDTNAVGNPADDKEKGEEDSNHPISKEAFDRGEAMSDDEKKEAMDNSEDIGDVINEDSKPAPAEGIGVDPAQAGEERTVTQPVEDKPGAGIHEDN